jgi:RNA polymerase sigma-70 factor (ECF subfamily)
MDDSELQLIRATGKGDHEAFEHLVKRYQNPLLNFVYRYVGNRQTAEDLTQEVFLQVYRAAARFEPKARVSTWVFKIAYNLCMNEIKRFKRLAGHELEMQKNREQQFATSLSPDAVEQVELKQFMTQSLTQLPEKQRAALLLRVTEGFSYQEISDVLGVSRASVESLLFRARERLRQLLARDEME